MVPDPGEASLSFYMLALPNKICLLSLHDGYTDTSYATNNSQRKHETCIRTALQRNGLNFRSLLLERAMKQASKQAGTCSTFVTTFWYCCQLTAETRLSCIHAWRESVFIVSMRGTYRKGVRSALCMFVPPFLSDMFSCLDKRAENMRYL